ncbi:hypothetical protein, partial [Enterobacter hormaechei]|uniref:hypothetical protein n=1 Tax=Enterobacter hormaechei TaxID=158836 RepID=UPI0013D2A8D6
AGALLAGGAAVWLVRALGRRPARPAFAIALAALGAGELAFHNVTTPINAEAKSVYAVFSAAPSPDRDALRQVLG